MIFVTVGNDFRNFDRLLKKMDEIAPLLPDSVTMQRGYSQYQPENTEYFDFVSMDASIEYMRKSKLVVSHAGIGTIILCKEYGIPLLILPRRKCYGEHMNDHQMEVAEALGKETGASNIYVLYDEGQLERGILRILAMGMSPSPVENPGKSNLIKTIRDFVDAV